MPEGKESDLLHGGNLSMPVAVCDPGRQARTPGQADMYDSQVERFFNRINQCRRIATRYDKFAANCLAFVQFASIRLWLHVTSHCTLQVTARYKSLQRHHA